MKTNCHICRKHPIQYRDYRFIESCGLQGKTLVCEWCQGLNDVAISDIIRDELDPKEFYEMKNRKGGGMKKKFIRSEEKIVNVIGSIKAELNETLDCEYKSYDNGDKSDDVLKGWIEGLEYALGCIDRKVAVNSKEKK